MGAEPDRKNPSFTAWDEEDANVMSWVERVGVQQKPGDLKIKASNLILINLLKDQVKTCHLPALPRQKELVSDLRPFHARLSYEGSIARRRPVYRCNDVQAEATAGFLAILRHYLESLCSDLSSHTITSVQSNKDRVSLLLKDSFIDSFSSRDRPFIKLSGYSYLKLKHGALSRS